MSRMTIRQLRDDEPIPTNTPKRYANASGYIRLRWLVGPEDYVEAYEHRIVMGRPPGQVHHLDGDKANNNKANLLVLSADAHTRLHQDAYRAAGKFKGRRQHREQKARLAAIEAEWALIAEEYADGASTTELGRRHGRDASNISRGLRRRGYVLRPKGGGW